MAQTLKICWQGLSENSLEHLVLKISSKGISADGSAVWNRDRDPFAFRYRLTCDPAWTVKSLRVDIIGEDKQLELFHDGEGNWRDSAGAAKRNLAGAFDVDLSASPFTNTLPIRRLKLKAGESARITSAYIHFPDLAVVTDRQKYTCLEEGETYLYESLDSTFKKEITVDQDGLVVVYPGLFKRTHKA